MIPAVLVMWAINAPAGYVVGDVYAHKNRVADGTAGFLRIASALFPPLALVLAAVLITQVSTGDDE